MNAPILITGIPRSGGWITAGIIHACGAFAGHIGHSERFYRKGTFENPAIRKDMVIPFMRGLGAEPGWQRPLPDINACRDAAVAVGANWRGTVEGILRAQGYDDGPWFYKSSSSALIWPVWHEAFPDARWVIVRRSDEEIIAACKETAYLESYQNGDGWRGWIDGYNACFVEIIGQAQIREIRPSPLLQTGDLTGFHDLIDWLGLGWNREAISAFIGPAMWKEAVYEVTPCE